MVSMGYIHEECCAACYGSQDLSLTDHKKRASCRYYQTGNCRRGSGCPFAHIAAASQAEVLPHPTYQTEHMYTYYPQTPVYHPLASQAYPTLLWQPYPTLSPPFDPAYGAVRPPETPIDYPDDQSDPSSAESSSTGTSMNHPFRTALDTAWSEGTESAAIRGITRPLGDLRINSSPGYAGYAYPLVPGIHAEQAAGRERGAPRQSNDQGSMVAASSPFPTTCQDDTKKKPLAYKTKPCKFYMSNGRCASGEKCTFIHDPEFKGHTDKSPPPLSPPPEAKLPQKPRNKYDDCRERDFYPITWRVIGGGVMMGGHRQTCPAFAAGHCKYGDDCKLAHETELEADLGFVDLRPEADVKVQGTPRQHNKNTSLKRGHADSLRRKSIKVPAPESQPLTKFPSTTPPPERPKVPALEGTEKARRRHEAVPTSPLHRRARSLTTIVTSPSTANAPHSNYAAEL